MEARRLADVCEAVVDCPHSTPVWTDSGVIVLRNQNIRGGRLDLSTPSYTDEKHYEERTRRIIPQKHDLVITREAPMGEVCLLPAGLRCCLGQRMVLLRVRASAMAPRYLLYALQSPAVQYEILVNEGTGSTVSNLRIPVLESLPIPCPPLPEQKRIAHILGTLDDKIELNRRMNATLEGISRAIFKSWFVDFDPVRQKAAGQQPVGMDAQTAALFPDSFEESEIGEVPTGWRVVPLPEIIEVNPTRSLRKGETAPYLDMANMPTSGHTPDELIPRPFGSGTRFMNGDTLLARITPCLENGKTAFIDCLQMDEVAWGSTEFIVLRPHPPLPPEFAYCLARDDGFREFAIQSMTGSSGRQRVPAESLGHFQLARPPAGLCEVFAERLQPYFRRIRAAADESRTLAALRDTLLPKLLSGEVRVPEAQEAVEEAVR